VNGARITVDYTFKDHDFCDHSILRLESPTYDRPIVQLGETEHFVAFLKPPSIPVHATGGYCYNSLVKRINDRLHPVHRLDRVTSGIIVMAKTKESAQQFSTMLTENKIHKTYLARVRGVFPEGDVRCDRPIQESRKGRSFRECRDDGKESLTLFKRTATNGVESIVECHPVTGRTHQIRVHLSALGFPITNDGMYGGVSPELSQEENDAIREAEERGLWPPDTAMGKDDPFLVFYIYLHSFHYQSDEFDFWAPMPEWAALEEVTPKETGTGCEVA
jgi:tRNA pseudouridine synthase 9